MSGLNLSSLGRGDHFAVTVRNCPLLADLSGLTGIRKTSADGPDSAIGVLIENVGRLTNFSSWRNFEGVLPISTPQYSTCSFVIRSNPAVTNFAGLDSLRAMTTFSVISNPALTTFDGLVPPADQIGTNGLFGGGFYSIVITDNAVLNDTDALSEQLSMLMSSVIRIERNPKLTTVGLWVCANAD